MVDQFDDIRPYEDNEINDAMQRIVKNPFFDKIAEFLYPDISNAVVKENFLSFNSVHNFQINFSDYAIRRIIKMTSCGLTFSGIENLAISEKYLFLSNHRDILLDAAILQIILVANKHDTSEITFGDNLMSSDFIIDIGKSNKMFRLIRGGTPKQIYINSIHTSKYIHHRIREKLESIWIAQRNGRTKDGNDLTQHAVLKMIGMSGGHQFAQNFAKLNITPTTISYEYDPCDYLKTSELYIGRRKAYEKGKDEDINSVLTGIMQFKGKIHLAISPPISLEDLCEIEKYPKNERIQNLANLIDAKIHHNYKLWNTNYIAFDLLNGSFFQNNYTAEEKANFIEYLNKMLSKIEGDKKELESIFLEIYANPVVNSLKMNNNMP